MPRSQNESPASRSAAPDVVLLDVAASVREASNRRRGSWRRWTWRPAAGWLLLLFVCGRIAWTLIRDAALDPTGGDLRAAPCHVSRVLDDGTLEVTQGGERGDAARARSFRVRLLGVRPLRTRPEEIDGPAADWLRAAAVGKRALLEFDRRRFDEQGRWLAYVAVDGVKLNVEWARAGWGRADGAPGDASAWRREIQRAEAEARRAARGGWRGAAPELVPPRPRG